jgi:putative transposase
MIKADPSLNKADGYKKLKKDCITAKDNNIIKTLPEELPEKFLYDWELLTPKDIRNGALRDIQKAFKTAFANLKNGNINHFGLNLRTKKTGSEQSMEIPNRDIKLIKKKGKIQSIMMYSNYIKDPIEIDKRSLYGLNIDDITKYCRLKKENNDWYLVVPYDAKVSVKNKQKKTCSIDPGVRKFAVVYSEEETTQIIPDHKKLNRYTSMLDKLQRLRDLGIIRNQSYNRARMRIQKRINNLVDELHYKTIQFLTDNYTDILLPSYETQDMVCSKKLSKGTKRTMMNLSSYKFQQRLIHNAELTGSSVKIVNEAYTSQTCGYCGNLKKTSDEHIKCDGCHAEYDRDINGARNIYLKYLQ